MLSQGYLLVQAPNPSPSQLTILEISQSDDTSALELTVDHFLSIPLLPTAQTLRKGPQCMRIQPMVVPVLPRKILLSVFGLAKLLETDRETCVSVPTPFA